MDLRDERYASGDKSIARRWNWRDVGARDAYAYYREGVCAAFMPLSPELDAHKREEFRFNLLSYDTGSTVVNHVSAASHTVTKGAPELAASPLSCYYLNLQLGGVCRIRQNGAELALRPGDLGLFLSDSAMELRHDDGPDLEVASLMVPKTALDERLADRRAQFTGKPTALSLHPAIGALAADSARAMLTALEAGETQRADLLQSVLLDLTAEALTPGATYPAGRSAQRRALAHQTIRDNARNPAFDLAACAEACALTPRALQRALSDSGETFSELLTQSRLDIVRRLLADPAHAHLPVATLAHDAGFRDVSHFGRLFRDHVGQSPGAWRAEQRAT